ncbi:uncharacterized protein [Centruroides vittatus]|uniref:uncharacterized protein n=1 Tax=Centruroides vittatus TaxID=120091 RepID=UPI003510CF18
MEKVDLALVQEPYCRRGVPACLRTTFKTESSQYVTCIEVANSQKNYLLISAYCPITNDLNQVLQPIDELINRYPHKNIVICGDFNAHSELWGDPNNDERADQILDFISANNLYLLNCPDSLPTFEAATGRSWIDLTMCNGSAMNTIKSWQVSPLCSLSDHGYIFFELDTNNDIMSEESTHYAVSRANWPLFKTKMDEIMKVEDLRRCTDRQTAELEINIFNERLLGACNECIPKKKKGQKAVPWWSDDLTKMRKHNNRLRRRF